MLSPRWKATCALVATLTIAWAGAALAAWEYGGNPAHTGSGTQYTGHDPLTTVGSSTCTDMVGGLIVACLAGTTPGAEIRINRLDAMTGDRRWGATGISVTAGVGSAVGPPHVVSDGDRGCWVVWLDNRAAAPGIYVQRYDQDGDSYFSPIAYPAGINVSDGAAGSINGDDDLDVAVTPSGKLFIAYWDSGLRLRRVSLAGALEWGTSGALVSTDLFGANRVDVSADGEGAVVVWESGRLGQPGPVSIFANRANSSGVMQWGAEGTLVFSLAATTPSTTRAEWDGSNLLVAWAQSRGSFRDVHVTRLNSSGSVMWGTTSGGITVLTALDTAWDLTSVSPQPQVVPDGAGGCIVAWVDGRDFSRLAPNGFAHAEDLYGQRVDLSGSMYWPANGAALDTLPGNQRKLQACADVAGGAILVYEDHLYSDLNIEARHVNASSTVTWALYVTPTGTDDAFTPVLARDGTGGFVAAWTDLRNGTQDVYGTHRGASGSPFVGIFALDAPVGGESVRVGDVLPITWTSNLAYENVVLNYSVDGVQGSIALTLNDGSYPWAVPNQPTQQAKVYLVAPNDLSPADSSGYFSICGALESAVPYGAGTGPIHVVTGDFNEDGISDLAVANLQSLNVSILLGNGTGGVGDGTFATASNYTAGSLPRRIATGDFNEDGITDLAVSHQNAVAILRGNGTGGAGDGTFAAAVDYTVGTGANGIVTADFNEDGIADIAVANSGSDNVSVLLGLGSGGVGNGTFGAATNYAVGDNPQRMVTGDFNEDGVWDFAVTNFGAVSNSVSVLLGNGGPGAGNGTFAAAVSYPVGTNPIGLATGDFNEDDIVDLVATNLGSDNVSVLLGNGAPGIGNGTFAAAVNYAPGGVDPRDVVVGDFTLDGRPDLAVAMSGTNEVRIMKGGGSGTTGNGTFTTPWVSGTGTTPFGIGVGNFLEDDIPDLATSNNGGANASVLLGGCGNPLSGAVTVVQANGGELWWIGGEYTIILTRGDGVMAVNIEISRDDGVTWETIARNLTTTLFQWTATPPATLTARVRVSDSTLPNRFDISDQSFRITDGAVGVPPGEGSATALSPARPNPTTGAVRMTLSMPRRGNAEVRVYDIAGRAVRTLLAGPTEAGGHAIVWDGLDAAGAPAASGLYFVRARLEGFEAVRRVVRME